MPTTRSACRTTAASQGDRTCVQTGRGGERTDDQGGQGDDQGVEANRFVDGINDFSGGAIAYTRWTEKRESVHDMSGCEANPKVKYAIGSLIGKALTWWNNQWGSGEVVAAEAVVAVAARGVVGRIDRETRSLFGFAGKRPPKIFPVPAAVAGWPAASCGWLGESIFKGCVCLFVITNEN
nr:reverse transcriptase domain-containing protein [Tanacetum cinerariifolium]